MEAVEVAVDVGSPLALDVLIPPAPVTAAPLVSEGPGSIPEDEEPPQATQNASRAAKLRPARFPRAFPRVILRDFGMPERRSHELRPLAKTC
jgi:hypothetical protein